MKAVDFIKKIKNDGKPLTAYCVNILTYEDGDDNACQESRDNETLDEFYYDYTKACEAVDKAASEQVADFGERIEVILMSAEVGPDDLDDIDWKEIDTLGEAVFGDNELRDLIDKNGGMTIDGYERVVCYDYRSVEDDLLVFWHWNRYVGYARDIEDIRRGYHGETTKLCIPVDHTFRTQCSILATKDEMEGLSADELRELVEDRLHDHYECEYTQGKWKWTMKAENWISSYLSEMED